MSCSASELRVRLTKLNMFKPSSVYTDRSKAVLLLWIFLLFMFHVYLYYTVLCVPCSLVITCWERADLSAILCVMFPRIWCIGSGVVLDFFIDS